MKRLYVFADYVGCKEKESNFFIWMYFKSRTSVIMSC